MGGYQSAPPWPDGTPKDACFRDWAPNGEGEGAVPSDVAGKTQFQGLKGCPELEGNLSYTKGETDQWLEGSGTGLRLGGSLQLGPSSRKRVAPAAGAVSAGGADGSLAESQLSLTPSQPPSAEPSNFLTLKPSQTDGCYIWPGRVPTAIPNISPNTFQAFCAMVILEGCWGGPVTGGRFSWRCVRLPSVWCRGPRDQRCCKGEWETTCAWGGGSLGKGPHLPRPPQCKIGMAMPRPMLNSFNDTEWRWEG